MKFNLFKTGKNLSVIILPLFFLFLVSAAIDVAEDIDYSSIRGVIIQIPDVLTDNYGELYGIHIGEVSIASSGVYYDITNTTAGLLNGFTHSEGNLTPLNSGIYQAVSQWSFSGGANVEYHLTIEVNGIKEDKCHAERVIGSGGDVGSASITCLLNLTAGDTVNLAIENEDNTANPTIHNLQFNLVKDLTGVASSTSSGTDTNDSVYIASQEEAWLSTYNASYAGSIVDTNDSVYIASQETAWTATYNSTYDSNVDTNDSIYIASQISNWITTYNSTYDSNIDTNDSIYIASQISAWIATYNVTYQGCINNISYLSTYNASYLSTYNSTYDSNIDTNDSVYIASKEADWTATYNASYIGSYNDTYNTWAYNQSDGTGSVGNPFDQDLNKSSLVSFTRLNVTDEIEGDITWDSRGGADTFRFSRDGGTTQAMGVVVSDNNIIMQYDQDLDEGTAHMWEFDFQGQQVYNRSIYSFRINNDEIMNITQFGIGTDKSITAKNYSGDGSQLTGISTYNSTYDSNVDTNDSVYIASQETNWTATYNETYHGAINNNSYLSTYNDTYNTWAYNQSDGIGNGGNPFDQDLNTTNGVSFNLLNITDDGTTLIMGSGANVENEISVSGRRGAFGYKNDETYLYAGGGHKIKFFTNGDDSTSKFEIWEDGSTNLKGNNLTTTGNITARYYFGDGSQLTNLPISSGNPFDQDLNTSNNVSFNNVSVDTLFGDWSGGNVDNPITNEDGQVLTLGSNGRFSFNNPIDIATDDMFMDDGYGINVFDSDNTAEWKIYNSNGDHSVNVTVEGNITASYYFGDGSQLTNLPSGGNSSWNQSYATTLFSDIQWNYNQTPTTFYNDTYNKWAYNMSDGVGSGGEPAWTANLSNMQTPCGEGNAVYGIDDNGNFLCRLLNSSQTVNNRKYMHFSSGSDSVSTDSQYIGVSSATPTAMDESILIAHDINVTGMYCYIETIDGDSVSNFTLVEAVDLTPQLSCQTLPTENTCIASGSITLLGGDFLTIDYEEIVISTSGHASCTIWYYFEN